MTCVLLLAPFAAGAASLSPLPSPESGPAHGVEVPPAAGAGGLDADQRAHVELARRLLSASPADDAPDLEGALRQARVGTLAQADLDPSPVAGEPAVDHETPSEAALALLDRHDVSPDPDQREEIRALDRLPGEVPGELADVVDAFVGVEQATERAFADADPAALADLEQAASRAPVAAEPAPSTVDGLPAAGVDLDPILQARARLFDEVGDLHRALETEPALPAGSGPTVHQPPALVLDLRDHDATYTRDTAWLVDAGGFDAYHNNAGGSGIGPPTGEVFDEDPCGIEETNPEPPPATPAAAGLVDLGDGDDVYGAPDDLGRCGQNGGGRHGSGLLVDAGGDDTYLAGNNVTLPDCPVGLCAVGALGVNGGASGGAGALVDAGGDDAYLAGNNVTVLACTSGNCNVGGSGLNGGGAAGSGLLVDAGGDDAYLAGNDVTLASCGGGDCNLGGAGVNGGANFGSASGLLLDAGGHDVYRTASDGSVGSCQAGTCVAGTGGVNGGASLGAQGLLVDAGGSDRYEVGEDTVVSACGGGGCSVVGAGVNGGSNADAGTLLDASGDDVYRAAPGVQVEDCSGGGCNVAHLGVNGGSALGSGLLADLVGDDAYQVGVGVSVGDCVGCNVAAVSVNGGVSFGQGLLFDGAGHDTYADNAGGTGTDRTVVPKGFLGAQVDAGPP